MLGVISIMFLGLGLGFLLRDRDVVGRLSSRLLTPAIWLLLFAMGLIVGSNEQIISNLPSLGLSAVVITLAALLGSVVAAWVVWNRFFRGHER